jgi:hypothetical protein
MRVDCVAFSEVQPVRAVTFILELLRPLYKMKSLRIFTLSVFRFILLLRDSLLHHF